MPMTSYSRTLASAHSEPDSQDVRVSKSEPPSRDGRILLLSALSAVGLLVSLYAMSSSAEPPEPYDFTSTSALP